MTFTDYLLDLALIAIVIRQVRESRLNLHTVLLPIAICTYVCFHYLHGVPTGGNDLLLVAIFTAVGIGCGVLSAATTRVRVDAKGALVKAGWVAAGTWVASMGFRFAFSLWAAHGGGADLMRFSVQHDITSGDAWTAALVLMAMGEVFVRTGLLCLRGARARAAARPAAPTVLAHA